MKSEKNPKVVVAVTNDLVFDRRVEKVCRSLMEWGWEPILAGRLLPGSPPLNRPYATKRFRLWWNKGALFYAFYNCRLLVFLLFQKVQAIHANDLDTLPACYLASRWKKVPLVYDSHEYFTEVPELQNRPFPRWVWRTWEARIFPRLKHVFTVNRVIAGIYQEQYGVPVQVVRNVPQPEGLSPKSPGDMKGVFRVILQGAGINIDRGAEELLEAFRLLDDRFHLYIIGSGDVWPWLVEKCAAWNLDNRVSLVRRIPYAELMGYTAACHLGVTLDKPTNANYRYSLPNKLFDYFRAGIPVLCSDLEVVGGIVRKHHAGWVVDRHEPSFLAETIRQIADDATYALRRSNAAKAASGYTWDCEVEPMKHCYIGLRHNHREL